MLDTLYNDLVRYILRYVGFEDYKSTVLTCKNLNKVLSDETFLKETYKIPNEYTNIINYVVRKNTCMRWLDGSLKKAFIDQKSESIADARNIADITHYGFYKLDSIKTHTTIKITNIQPITKKSSNCIIIGLADESKTPHTQNVYLIIDIFTDQVFFVLDSKTVKCSSSSSFETNFDLELERVEIDNILKFYVNGEYLGSTKIPSEKIGYPMIISPIPLVAEFIE